jgi:integrase
MLARREPPSAHRPAAVHSIPRAKPGLPLRRPAKHRPSWKRALQDIITAHNDRHATKPKGVSFKTQSERAAALFRCFRDLHALGFKIRNPYCLGGRHVCALMEDWTGPEPRSRRQPLSPATIHTELSHLRTFTVWIGKPGLVLPAESYVSDPSRVARTCVAVSDKSWAPREVEPDRRIEDIAAHDPWVGAELRLARAFGLRVKEAVMLQPRLAEKSGGRSVDPSEAARRYLELTRGTKGGRLRRIPIDTPAKRASLDAAKALVSSESQYLADPARTLKQNLDRLHNVMKKFGVTRSALGVTPHGLRHGYAADRYEALAGAAAPVRGGAATDRATDERARLQVAEELGHGRIFVAAAYLGSPRVGAAPPVSASPGDPRRPATTRVPSRQRRSPTPGSR